MADLAEPFKFQGDDDLRFLRDELYDGSWEFMLADLEARLKMKPSVFKISANIREDIAAIRRMMAAESAQEGAGDEDGSGKTEEPAGGNS
jgi:hypothetical protein